MTARPHAPYTHPLPEASTEEIVAADAFRTTILPRADTHTHGDAPLWYGWALFDAFIAGVRWQQQKAAQADTEADDGP